MAKISEDRVNTFLDFVRLWHQDTGFHRLSLESEGQLLDQIRAGDFRNIQISPFSELKSGFGLIAKKPEKTYEYFTASAIALFSRLVIECGVEADEALDLSDALLLLLAEAKNEQEIHDVFQLSAVMFARQVYDVSQEPGVYLVRKSQNYIRRNLFHKLSIQEIADYVGRTPNYLSNVFLKQTGFTIHNYIQKERIAIAKNLLSHTNHPVAEVSVHLGFESPSNFTVVFRKWENMTPTEYRNKTYKEVF